jgi:polar amino acid transport system substrate-binding protein
MKRVSLALVAALAAVLAVSCSGKKADSGDLSLKAVTDKGTFVLGLDDAFPPMGFRNDKNEIVGFDIDLATEVAKRMGVTLVTQPISWDAKEQELNTGKIDCIWNGLTITAEREAAMSFTKPYLSNAQVLVVRADATYKTLADLKGKKVALQAGSSAADALASATDFKASLKEVVEMKDNLTALMDLEMGGVDAVVMDSVVAKDTIVRMGKPYAVLAETLASENYGVGFRKADIALRDKVQATLEAMAADGTIAKISTTWFGSDIATVGK